MKRGDRGSIVKIEVRKNRLRWLSNVLIWKKIEAVRLINKCMLMERGVEED